MRETQHIEFKESWRDEYLKWICGFANAAGGVLIIGRNDRGEAVGVSDATKLLEDLPNKIRDMLGVMVAVNLLEEGGFDLIEIRVDAYLSPISFKGRYYLRSGSTNQLLKGAALDRFLMRKQGQTWDGVPVPHVGIEDLSPSAMEVFRNLARQGRRLDAKLLQEPDAVLVEKLNLLDGSYLKRAAILLFHPEPDRFFAGAFVKLGYFQNESNLLYHDEIHGDLFSQTQKTMDILFSKYLKAVIGYQGIHRVETLPVPEEALREAILNAIIHRDYAIGAPVQIRVYADRLLIWNAGVLPENWTAEKLMQPHSSRPYNPTVANAFFRAGEIEAWGRGIQRMIDVCNEAGVPIPKVSYEPDDLRIEFQFSDSYVNAMSESASLVGEKTLPKTPPKTQGLILEQIRNDPHTTLAGISEIIGVSLSATKRASSRLVKEGKIKYVGPAKGGHWEMLEEGE